MARSRSLIQSTEQSPASNSEIVGIIAAAVVLFLAFGSLFAMALPILTGVAGVGGGLLAVGLLTHATAIADFAPSLGALIGLGVGIDYALFIVTRFRCALRSGQDVGEAVRTAVNTSGRAVLFAGGTVCIALASPHASDKQLSQLQSRTFTFTGDREMIRDRAAKMALTMLRFKLLEKPMPI